MSLGVASWIGTIEGWLRSVRWCASFRGRFARSATIAAAEQVAERHRPIEQSIGGVVAFPNFRRARVVWIGVEQESVRMQATANAERITLFESIMAPSGARYRRMHAATLGGR